MHKNIDYAKTLKCGHSIRVDHLARRLELLGLMPCSACVDWCEDHHRWLDERADDAERASRSSWTSGPRS